MLIELPITLINKKESELVGSDAAESKPGSVTINVNYIQCVVDVGDDRESMLYLNSGVLFVIPAGYEEVKQIVMKSMEMAGGRYFASYVPKKKFESDEPIPVVKEEENVQRCSVCRGLNLEIMPDAPAGKNYLKKCLDCGTVNTFLKE